MNNQSNSPFNSFNYNNWPSYNSYFNGYSSSPLSPATNMAGLSQQYSSPSLSSGYGSSEQSFTNSSYSPNMFAYLPNNENYSDQNTLNQVTFILKYNFICKILS